MTVFADISGALDEHLYDMTSLPSVAWPNKNFSPVTGTLYIRPTLIPGDSTQATLGEDGEDMNVGVYQVDVFAEAGKGKQEAMRMVDKIADRFKRGTDLTYNSRNVRIRNVNQLPAINNPDGWFQVPIEIVYISYTQPRI